MSKTSKRSRILFNKMYTGEFTENNIGHEIINLFKSDNGSNYIYVLPYGGIGTENNDSISCILLISPVKNGKFYVLAKAEGLEQINRSGNKGGENAHEEQVKYIIDNKITYGGEYLHKIMQENDGDEKAVYITFKADSVIKARKPIEIKMSECASTGNSNPQRSKSYIDTPNDYFANILENNELWEESNTTKKVDTSGFQNESIRDNTFLQLIKKEYDENVFSNMLEYYLSNNNDLFNDFFSHVLHLAIDNSNLRIQREKVTKNDIAKENSESTDSLATDESANTRTGKKRIDIWIENDTQTVVIENKIKSGINGSRHDLESGTVINQLNDYKEFSKRFRNKEHYYYIFAPDYNDIPAEDGKYQDYTIIRYSKLYEFFKDKKPNVDKYGLYDQFVAALAKHIYSADKEMERRFVLAITKAKNSNQ